MSYQSDALALSLAHYWRLGSLSNPTPDSAGSSPLTIGASTHLATGAIPAPDDDGAMSFDGSTGNLHGVVDWSDTSVITFAAWVKMTSYDNTDGLLAELTASWNSNDGAISIDPNNSTGGAEANTWSIGMGGPSGKHRVTIPQSDLPTGAWHHLAIVFNLTSNSIKVYVDGTLVSATLRDNATPTTPFANSTLYIAARAGTAQFGHFDLDEVVVAKRELTSGQIGTLALAPSAGGPATIYVDNDAAGSSDAHDRTQAQDPTTAVKTLARAIALALDGDTIEVVKRTGTYAALVAELAETTAANITIKGHAGGTNRPVIDSATIGDVNTWTLQDLIFSGTPGNSSFIYRTNALTVTRCDFQQGGGQILNWTGHMQFIDCDIAAPWDSAHGSNFMTGVGWRITSEFSTDIAAEDFTFLRCHFHDIGGEDAIQLLLGNNSMTGTLTVDTCHFENVAQGSGSSSHTDCIQSTGCHNLVVKNSRFETSESMIISSDDFIDSLVLENSLFVGSSISGFSVQLSGVKAWSIRNNTWVNSRFGGLRFYVNNNVVASPVGAVFNNIIDAYEIDTDWVPTTSEQHHNLIGAGPITTADTRGFAEFGTSSDTDWELANSPVASRGIDAGTATGAPTTDRLGRVRHGATDMGCHESNPAVLVSVGTRPPRVISMSPADGATGVDTDVVAQIVLFPKPGETIDASTVTSTRLKIRDADGYEVIGAQITIGSLDGNGYQTVTIDPTPSIGRLFERVQFTTTIGAGVADSEGSTTASSTSASWRTLGPSGPAVQVASAGWALGMI